MSSRADMVGPFIFVIGETPEQCAARLLMVTTKDKIVLAGAISSEDLPQDTTREKVKLLSHFNTWKMIRDKMKDSHPVLVIDQLADIPPIAAAAIKHLLKNLPVADMHVIGYDKESSHPLLRPRVVNWIAKWKMKRSAWTSSEETDWRCPDLFFNLTAYIITRETAATLVDLFEDVETGGSLEFILSDWNYRKKIAICIRVDPVVSHSHKEEGGEIIPFPMVPFWLLQRFHSKPVGTTAVYCVPIATVMGIEMTIMPGIILAIVLIFSVISVPGELIRRVLSIVLLVDLLDARVSEVVHLLILAKCITSLVGTLCF